MRSSPGPALTPNQMRSQLMSNDMTSQQYHPNMKQHHNLDKQSIISNIVKHTNIIKDLQQQQSKKAISFEKFFLSNMDIPETMTGGLANVSD